MVFATIVVPTKIKTPSRIDFPAIRHPRIDSRTLAFDSDHASKKNPRLPRRQSFSPAPPFFRAQFIQLVNSPLLITAAVFLCSMHAINPQTSAIALHPAPSRLAHYKCFGTCSAPASPPPFLALVSEFRKFRSRPRPFPVPTTKRIMFR